MVLGDGQTVVLGGILDDQSDRSQQPRCRGSGDIPVLGNLFKTTTKTNNKDELLIFVTPKILREDAR